MDCPRRRRRRRASIWVGPHCRPYGLDRGGNLCGRQHLFRAQECHRPDAALRCPPADRTFVRRPLELVSGGPCCYRFRGSNASFLRRAEGGSGLCRSRHANRVLTRLCRGSLPQRRRRGRTRRSRHWSRCHWSRRSRSKKPNGASCRAAIVHGRLDLGLTAVTASTDDGASSLRSFWRGQGDRLRQRCNAKGDFVADTPPEKTPTSGCPVSFSGPEGPQSWLLSCLQPHFQLGEVGAPGAHFFRENEGR